MVVNMQKTMALILSALLCLPVFAETGLGSEEATFEVASDAWTQMARGQTGAADRASPRAELPDGEGLGNSSAIGANKPARPLNIFVLMGNKAINSIHSATPGALVIEVRDERNLPLEGVDVLFQAPRSGPGGFFPGQQLTWSGRTDMNGQVVAPGLTPNMETGHFGIQVTATRGAYIGHSIISQTNSGKPATREAGPQAKGTNWWKIIAITAGCGAAAGIALALHGSGDKPTVVLQPGPITVGGPR